MEAFDPWTARRGNTRCPNHHRGVQCIKRVRYLDRLTYRPQEYLKMRLPLRCMRIVWNESERVLASLATNTVNVVRPRLDHPNVFGDKSEFPRDARNKLDGRTRGDTGPSLAQRAVFEG